MDQIAVNRVRAVREARGLSLRALARKVGMLPTHLSQVERGLAGCSDARKARISEVLTTPVGVLFFGEDVRQRSTDEDQACLATTP